ncbi:MAG: tRNA lysidine(34) synthetase TilS [Planctomycetota bacterium]
MEGPQSKSLRLLRDDPAVRRITADWRRLTGGRGTADADRGTLVMCSGGADSSALLLALASTPGRIGVFHAVHDMRACPAVLSDRDAAKRLATDLGLTFFEAEARGAEEPGNIEQNLRERRYDTVERIACEHAFPFVATGHHADDQAETVLMRLLRGAGPRGLRGILPRRELGRGVVAVRPMLTIPRIEAERVCEAAGWQWCDDPTNRDIARVRSQIRHRVMPVLRDVRWDAAEKLSGLADIAADCAGLVATEADRVIDRADASAGGYTWSLAALRGVPAVVLGEVALRVSGSDEVSAGLRRAALRSLEATIAGDQRRLPAVFTTGNAVWRVTGSSVSVAAGA